MAALDAILATTVVGAMPPNAKVAPSMIQSRLNTTFMAAFTSDMSSSLLLDCL